jgi:hypothetical protein
MIPLLVISRLAVLMDSFAAPSLPLAAREVSFPEQEPLPEPSKYIDLSYQIKR